MMSKAKAFWLSVIITLSFPFSQFISQGYTASSPTTDVAMVVSDPMPVIEVMINGKGPFRFAIDTGAAAQVILSSPLIEQLSLTPTGETRVGDPSGKNALTTDTFQLESITIGETRFSSVNAIKIDLPPSPSGHSPLGKIDGILGFPLFSDYLLTLDYVAGRVRLEQGSLPEPDGAEVLSFERPQRIPVVEVDIAGTKVKAHLDSGSTRGSIGLNSSMIDQLPLAAPPTVAGKARTVNNEYEIKTAPLKGSVRIGKHEFPQPTLSFSELSRGGNIGANILRQFALTFDQKNNRVRLLRKATSPTSATASSAMVDVPMLSRGPMPAVEVMVNGKGPFLFAIDTGASGQGRIDSSLVEKLALPQVGEARGSDGSGNNAQSMKVVQVETLTLGNLEFKNLNMPSRDYNLSPSLPHIDGILGFNLFADYLLTLDYAAKRVRVEKGQLPETDGKEILSFENNRVPTVELQVGDAKLKAHIDSGNTAGAFMLPASLAEKLSFASPPITVGKARTVSSEIEIKEGRLKGSIRLGRFEFPEPTVSYPAVSENGNIGSRALQDFALTFDQKNLRVKLIRQEKSKASSSSSGHSSPLEQYAGKYGQRTIFFENGALFLQRTGGPKLKLVPVSDGEYTLEEVPTAKIKFVKKDNTVEMQVLNPQGEWEAAKKEGGI